MLLPKKLYLIVTNSLIVRLKDQPAPISQKCKINLENQYFTIIRCNARHDVFLPLTSAMESLRASLINYIIVQSHQKHITLLDLSFVYVT